MKKKYIMLILAVLIAVSSFGIIMKIHPKISRSSEVIDLSSIKLPEYPLPKRYITKQQAIDIAMRASKGNLHHGQVPKNPQCVLLPRGIGEKILYGNPQPSKDELDEIKKEMPKYGLKIPPDYEEYKKRYEEYQERLLYFVIIDVNRAPDEVTMTHPHRLQPPKLIDGKWLTTQDTYAIDAATGKIVGHGYYGIVKHIYPRQ